MLASTRGRMQASAPTHDEVDRCIGKATIPHRFAEPPLHKGAIFILRNFILEMILKNACAILVSNPRKGDARHAAYLDR